MKDIGGEGGIFLTFYCKILEKWILYANQTGFYVIILTEDVRISGCVQWSGLKKVVSVRVEKRIDTMIYEFTREDFNYEHTN